jgi:hypothetical protein
LEATCGSTQTARKEIRKLMGEGYDTARIVRGEETRKGCKTGSEIPHPGQFSGKLRAAAPEGFTKGVRGKEKQRLKRLAWVQWITQSLVWRGTTLFYRDGTPGVTRPWIRGEQYGCITLSLIWPYFHIRSPIFSRV